jgi:hypothetical protein
MDPLLTQAWMMIARIKAAVGDRDAVRDTLEQAVASNSIDQVLEQAQVELGPRFVVGACPEKGSAAGEIVYIRRSYISDFEENVEN